MQQVARGIRVERNTEQVKIALRRLYYTGNGCAEIVLFVMGAAFLGFPLAGLLSGMGGDAPAVLRWGDVVAIVFLVLGLLIVYRSLTIVVNTDVIRMDRQWLKVRSGPLPPWDSAGLRLPAGQVLAAESKMNVSHSKNSNRPSGTTITYSVKVTLSDGSSKVILSGAGNSEAAHFVANEINDFLKTIRLGG